MQSVASAMPNFKKSDQKCPKHHIAMVFVGNHGPFCRECAKEDVEREKEETAKRFKLSLTKGVLMHDSLFNNHAERNYTFDTFKASQGTKEAQIKRRSKHIAYDYIKYPTKAIHTVFYGIPGEGKTHLAVSMMKAINEHSKKPQKCLFVSMPTLFRKIKHSFSVPTELWTVDYAIKKLTSVDVLALDDLGSESAMKMDSEASNFIQEVLFEVLERQTRLIITTNLTENQLKKVYNPKLVSRMLASSKGYVIDFSGIEDKR